MATDYFVKSGATGLNNGTGTFTNFTDAFTDIDSAFTAAVLPGDRIIVELSHYQTWVASKTFTNNIGSGHGNRVKVILVDEATGLPVKNVTTPNLDITGAASDFAVAGGLIEFVGVYVKVGRRPSIPANTGTIFKNGKLWINEQGTGLTTVGSNGTAVFRLQNTDLILGTSAGALNIVGGYNEILGGSISGSVMSGLSLINPSTLTSTTIVKGVDLSGLGSDPLCSNANAGTNIVIFEGCVLAATDDFTLFRNAYPSVETSYIEYISCGISASPDLTFRKRITYRGTITTDKVVYRSFTHIETDEGSSQRIETLSSVDSASPIHMDLRVVAPQAGSFTLTMQVAHNMTNPVKDTELFIDVLAPDSSSNQLGYYGSNSIGNILHDEISAGVDLPTSSESWVNGSGDTITTQKLEIPIAVNHKGVFTIRLYFNKYEAGKWLSVDPVVETL